MTAGIWLACFYGNRVPAEYCTSLMLYIYFLFSLVSIIQSTGSQREGWESIEMSAFVSAKKDSVLILL